VTSTSDRGAPPPTTESGDADNKLTPGLFKIAGVVVFGMIMSVLDTTVVNVALPTFLREFRVSEYSTVAWAVAAYTLALAAVIPVTGWAADRFGTKRLYLTALSLFTLGSVLCASAWSIESLICFRVLQGLGGGMLMPLGMAILTNAAGPKRVGRLMAIMGIPLLLGPILGPILGGWLIDAASWHWIFLINLPLGAVAIVYARFALERDAPTPAERFDVIGMLLMSPGLALFLYGVSSIPDAGTVAATRVLLPGTTGAVLIIAFAIWVFRPEHPLLDLRLFKDRNMAVAMIVLFLYGAAFFGGLLLVPTYFQQVRGEDVLRAGLLVAPQGLGAMIIMPIAGSLSDRMPIGRIVPFGVIGVIIGMVGLAVNTRPDTPYWHILTFLFVMGLGMGATMMPIMTSALKTLRAHQVARGSTLMSVIEQVAGSVGVAVIAMILTSRQNSSEPLRALHAFGAARAEGTQPPSWALDVAQRLGGALEATGQADLAASYSSTYWVAAVALVVTLIPVALLPHRRERSHLLNADQPERAH
jgi:EmrB/QacA subfamily drug resistance transporter